jgi:hypothetical protein
MKFPLVQNEPEEVFAIEPEVNVLWTTPIKSIPNDNTAETSTGTIASLKNGINQTSPMPPPPSHHHPEEFKSFVFQSPSLSTAYASPKSGENIT